MPKTTISVIKAAVGSFPGPSRTHPKLIEKAQKMLREEEGKLLVDSFVAHCGDNLELIMTHFHGVGNEKIHAFAGDVFSECTKIAKNLKLYGSGAATLAGTPAGNFRLATPGIAEIEFEERESDPVLIFMTDETGPGVWNFFLYRMFADPINTVGLATDPLLHEGFVFEVHDLVENRRRRFTCPEEIYDMLAYIGVSSRYVVRNVYRRNGEIAAATSIQTLNPGAGRKAENEDPVMIVRAQGGFPSVGEALEPFSIPVLVAGWMGGSHHGPLMPVSLPDANSTRSDGPPRVICFGFQVNKGELVGPADMFDDPAFDRVRARCGELAEVVRAQGPFGFCRGIPGEVMVPPGGKEDGGMWEKGE